MDNKNVGLKEILVIYKKYKKHILSFTLIVSFLAILYSFFSAPLYKSYISIYPANQDSMPFSGLEGLASSIGINLMGSESNTFNIPDIINSRRLKKNITSRKWNSSLHSNKIDLIKYWDIYDSKESYEYLQNESINILSTRMSVYEHESGLITVSILMEDEVLAANIVNFISVWIQNYISNEMKTKATKNRVFIENQLANAKNDLFESEEELADFQRKHSIADDNPDVFLKRARLIRNIEVNQQVYITLRQQFELNKIEELKEKPVINILDSGDIPTEKSKPLRFLIVFSAMFLSFFSSLLFMYSYDGLSDRQIKNKT